MTRNRLYRRVFAALVAGAVSLAVSVGCVALVGPSVSLDEDVLHAEASRDSGVGYEYVGTEWSSDLYLVRVRRLTGLDYELRLGPDAAHYYYPVELRFGGAEPRIADVDWQAEGVTVAFESGDSVHVPADNFRGVR
ncbi:hypothetical protein [Marinitenerispora sediminis]|uniref:Uncharacterized protein n=1 Tax=Marinitenerispora sediminis TaxID=1931232 RepID=A0A368T756_9ACTN|nr:hypothetical protein [Marinitenerispora sediminis]RCV50908.1 hypothetical protein DEF28_16780 [Marinitenerispora sediminis]RCV59732.1 hypothetical protein DEF23_06585 [Marinitenerispora sediminis]RCV59816.1 hypothetical protein DEF24_08645 [Marinitenerispora sediminis]